MVRGGSTFPVIVLILQISVLTRFLQSGACPHHIFRSWIVRKSVARVRSRVQGANGRMEQSEGWVWQDHHTLSGHTWAMRLEDQISGLCHLPRPTRVICEVVGQWCLPQRGHEGNPHSCDPEVDKDSSTDFSTIAPSLLEPVLGTWLHRFNARNPCRLR